MVSAWAEGNGLVLGQRKVDEKSNEITAIPKPGSPATGLRRWGGSRGPQRQVFVAGVEAGVPSDRSSSLGWKLLDALELAGTVVTIDAMGCQRAIAQRIIAKKADYVLAVKENQGNLLDEIKDSFLLLESDAVAEEIDCGHGRVEQRRCSVIADLSMIEKAAEWASIQGLVRIQSERYHKVSGKIEREIRYYITSLRPEIGRASCR